MYIATQGSKNRIASWLCLRNIPASSFRRFLMLIRLLQSDFVPARLGAFFKRCLPFTMYIKIWTLCACEIISRITWIVEVWCLSSIRTDGASESCDILLKSLPSSIWCHVCFSVSHRMSERKVQPLQKSSTLLHNSAAESRRGSLLISWMVPGSLWLPMNWQKKKCPSN